jgi:isopentenyl-diphosphate Delta-isomerase
LHDRKKEHIELAVRSQMNLSEIDNRFIYEPMLSPHPSSEDSEFLFLGKSFKLPMWVSSMTGGTPLAREINTNLARVCRDFGMGMGLGSCRSLLKSDQFFPDFDLRKVIGDDRALYANLGIGQVEQSIEDGTIQKIHDMVARLNADGLIIHVNPIQEWMQPEGDRFRSAPVETIERFIHLAPYRIVIKEVGQGMGGKSLQALMRLPIEAIEFAAFGGTNFALVEMLRNDTAHRNTYEPLSRVGVDAAAMLDEVNNLTVSGETLKCRQIIISGGVRNFLDGYYYIAKSKLPAVYGQASTLLSYAKEGYEELHAFVKSQAEGLRMAKSFLRVRQ